MYKAHCFNPLRQQQLQNTGKRFTMTQPQNFQPQVRDTTAGPNLHTYIPRDDGSVTINGVTFLPQSRIATAATIPVTASGIPVATSVPLQSYVIPPGGPAIPGFVSSPVKLTPPQCYTFSCYCFPLHSVSSGLSYSACPFPSPYDQLPRASRRASSYSHFAHKSHFPLNFY